MSWWDVWAEYCNNTVHKEASISQLKNSWQKISKKTWEDLSLRDLEKRCLNQQIRLNLYDRLKKACGRIMMCVEWMFPRQRQIVLVVHINMAVNYTDCCDTIIYKLVVISWVESCICFIKIFNVSVLMFTAAHHNRCHFLLSPTHPCCLHLKYVCVCLHSPTSEVRKGGRCVFIIY